MFWYYLILPNFQSADVIPLLDTSGILLFVIMILLIAGAGYVINDIVDIDTDRLNNGEDLIITNGISLKNANYYYFILSLSALSLSLYLAVTNSEFNFLVIFAIATLALYFYSKRLKSSILFGNIVVSLLIALVPFIFLFVEGTGFEALKLNDIETYLNTFTVLIAFTIFAFLSNFIRELVKDCEDIEGDRLAGITTLATAFGTKKVEKICIAISILLLLLCLFWSNNIRIWESTIELIYFIIGLLIPIIFIILNLRREENNKAKYTFLSRSLKILMASGLFYLFLHLNA